MLFEVALTTLLAAHLLCVNVASAGPVVAIWLDWREAAGDSLAGQAGRFLCWAATGLLVVGSGLGLLLGAAQWSPAYREILRVFQRRISFGVWEILFSLLLMLLCAIWWSRRPESSRAARGWRTVLQVAASTNLLYHFPFLFVVLSDALKGHITVGSEPVGSGQFRQLISESTVWARVTHIWLASFAVTGLVLIFFAMRHHTDNDATRVAKWGARLGLLASVPQIPVGIWIAITSPRPTQLALLGGDLVSSSLLAASILLTLALLHSLAAAAWGDSHRKHQLQAVAVMLLVVFLMTAVLRRH